MSGYFPVVCWVISPLHPDLYLHFPNSFVVVTCSNPLVVVTPQKIDMLFTTVSVAFYFSIILGIAISSHTVW